MAMFENFPYTDMHNLNLDWIIKIAKDFLDQYTHIQQLIADGETSLQNLTDEGMEELQNKADNLEELLQAWYNEHSQDIANQLAAAISDLNDWYTRHQDYLNTYLNNSITAFNTAADTKAAQTIASIPADYTTLANQVQALDDSVGTYFDFNNIKGFNLFNSATIIDDSFINPANGILYPNTDTYKATDFIPINAPFLIIRSYISFTNAGTNAAFYDADKEYLMAMTVNDLAQWTNLYYNGAYYVKVDVPQTAKYFRYSALNAFFAYPDVIGMYESGIEWYDTKYVPFSERLKIANMPKGLLAAICASVGGEFNNSWNNSWLAPGFTYQMGVRSSIKGPQILSFFSIVSSMGELVFGFHDTSYCFHIDATNIWYSSNGTPGDPIPHNLTIQNYLNVIIELDGKGSTAKIKINTNGGSAEFTNIWFISTKGRPRITSVGYSGTYTQAGWCSKLSRPIWMFGDSYFSSYSEKRWTYYLYEWGLDDNVILNAYDGENSQQAMDDFTNMLYIGIPKYAVWCMGMNDGDTTEINADWLSGVQAFIITCNEKGITPILATIPNTPTVNNTYKNTWIRNSGYRYIDFANAVNADSAGATWFPNMREDNVHPSEQGAICLASEFVSAFPEIAIK